MNSHSNETFYLWVIILGWAIIPVIVGMGFFVFFARMTNAYKKHKDFANDRKKKIKWGYRWNGTPYQKDSGWGNDCSKLDEDEYFIRLNALGRKEEEGTAKKASK